MRQDQNKINIKDTESAKGKEDFNTFYLTRSKGERQRLPIKKDINIARRWRVRHDLKAH
jgi:hypothetical protein